MIARLALRVPLVGALASIAVALLIVMSAVTAAAPRDQARPAAPDFTLDDTHGKPFRLSAHRGRVVLVDFWATWCAGCKVEIPWFVAFQKKYGARGLTSVGVAMDDEGWSKVRPYLKEHPITYPVVVGNLALMTDTFKVAPSLPLTLLIDRRGRIAASHSGVVDKNDWERRIVALLAEKNTR
ncbi:MAG TPA: redoxin domain-containing protein [Luteitalea sp.]|nr:redoxin domain-containing protein [Luteitalea sp.]